jgi:hypothetical protein
MRTFIAILILLLALPAQAGTWGFGQFDNDEALDRSSSWADAGSVSDIQRSLEAIASLTYIEASEATTALVAAEVVAAAAGRPSPDLPTDLRVWIDRQSAQELVALAPAAKLAISKIVSADGSELHELWADADLSDWLAAVAELSNRLAAISPAVEPK